MVDMTGDTPGIKGEDLEPTMGYQHIRWDLLVGKTYNICVPLFHIRFHKILDHTLIPPYFRVVLDFRYIQSYASPRIDA
jgi:hypothetical protein